MIPSKKKRGFRKIVVDECQYVWRAYGNVTIRLANSPSNSEQLVIDYGYYDVWLFVNDPENAPPDFEPKAVTPRFIEAAIRSARENGWSPENAIGVRNLFYREEKFSSEAPE